MTRRVRVESEPAEQEEWISVYQASQKIHFSEERINAVIAELQIPVEQRFYMTTRGKRKARCIRIASIPAIVEHIEREGMSVKVHQSRTATIKKGGPLDAPGPDGVSLVDQLQSEIAYLRSALIREQKLTAALVEVLRNFPVSGNG